MPSPNGFSGSLPRDRQWLATRADWHPALQAVPQRRKPASLGLRHCISPGTYSRYPAESTVIGKVLWITRHQLQVVLILQVDQKWVHIVGNASSFSLKKLSLICLSKETHLVLLHHLPIPSLPLSVLISLTWMNLCLFIVWVFVVQAAAKHMPQSSNLGENEGDVFCL